MNFDDRRLPPRFWKRVYPEPNSGCWIWVGAANRLGYGNIHWKGKTVPVHRLAYDVLVAPIPKSLYPDHLCRTPSCVNPSHMEPVTHRENILRGTSPFAVNAAKTHCKNGHLFDAANTIRDAAGRRCKTCKDNRQRARRARARLEFPMANCPICHPAKLGLHTKGEL